MDTNVRSKQIRVRSSTGCIGCRLRRKKCGEQKPRCTNCVRNEILCTWQEPGNIKHAEILKRTNPTRSRLQSGPRVGSPAYIASPTPSTPATPHSALQITANLFRDAVPLSLDPQMLGGNALLREPLAQKLFYHYLHRTNKVMATCHSRRNPYVTELVPLAMANPLILHTLLACSGIHYAEMTGSAVDAVTWMHYGQAIQAQKFGLTQLAQGQTEVLVGLVVTALLLCIVETFRVASGTEALYHLRAGRVLLRKALRLPMHILNQSVRVFLIERYTYTMTLAHISMGPESDEWVLQDAAMLFPMMQNELSGILGADSNSILGGVHELFQLIPTVSVLARHWRAENDLGIRLGHTVTELSELRSAVANWQSSQNDGVRSLCGRLYQHALLVYIAACFDDEASSVEKAFNAFTAFLASIPLDSPISTTMCWPLAVSGSCARTKTQRQVIAQKLDQLSTAYASQSVRDTKRLLERLWEGGDVWMANPLGLEDIMKKERITVLLL